MCCVCQEDVDPLPDCPQECAAVLLEQALGGQLRIDSDSEGEVLDESECSRLRYEPPLGSKNIASWQEHTIRLSPHEIPLPEIRG